MEAEGGIEPPTISLTARRSTAELLRPLFKFTDLELRLALRPLAWALTEFVIALVGMIGCFRSPIGILLIDTAPAVTSYPLDALNETFLVCSAPSPFLHFKRDCKCRPK